MITNCCHQLVLIIIIYHHVYNRVKNVLQKQKSKSVSLNRVVSLQQHYHPSLQSNTFARKPSQPKMVRQLVAMLHSHMMVYLPMIITMYHSVKMPANVLNVSMKQSPNDGMHLHLKQLHKREQRLQHRHRNQRRHLRIPNHSCYLLLHKLIAIIQVILFRASSFDDVF
jgi:hypothetical protein